MQPHQLRREIPRDTSPLGPALDWSVIPWFSQRPGIPWCYEPDGFAYEPF